jgi:hypothetical protein
MNLHSFLLKVAHTFKETFPPEHQSQIPLERILKLLRHLKANQEEIQEFTQFMKDTRWLEVSNNVQSINMRNLDKAVRLAQQVSGASSGATPSDPQLLEADLAMPARVEMLNVYEKVSEAVIEGHQYSMGDFTISVGNFKKRSRVQALIVEIQYRPCVHAEHANEVFESMMELLGSPQGSHRDEQWQKGPPWKGLKLPKLYSPRHTAAQYVKLASRITTSGRS